MSAHSTGPALQPFSRPGGDDVAPTHPEAVQLERARRGDTTAFSALYDLNVRAVYLYALRVVRTVPDAEDVTQETFLVAWKRREAIRIVDQSILPWLLVTARNLGLNRVRRNARENRNRAREEDLADSTAPRSPIADGIEAKLLADAIRDAVAQLSTTDQRLYVLCIERGLSYSEAAAVLGTSHGAVRNRLSRLRGSLRLTLTDHKEGLS